MQTAILAVLCAAAGLAHGRELQQMSGMMSGGSMMMSPMGSNSMMMMPMSPMSGMMAMSPMSGMASNAFAAIQMNSNLSTLATALMKANLSMALSDPMFVGTIFAPTNDAFMRFLGARNMTVDQLLMSPNLKMILEYHVVPGMAAKASMLMNGMKLSTMANSPLMVAAMPAPATIFGAQTNAIVQMADMMAGKAIIHVINQVLLPPANMMTSS